MYTIEYADEAREDFKNLPAAVRREIAHAIEERLRRGWRGRGGDGSCHPTQAASPNNGGGCMKVIAMQQAKLDACVRFARRQAVVLTRRGKPVAVMFGIKGMDLEQLELSLDPEFWKMIEERRKQPTITHEQLLQQLDEWEGDESAKPAPKKKGTA
jgi:hypothetical protein